MSKQKYKTTEVSEEITKKIYEVEDRFEVKISRTLGLLFMAIEKATGFDLEETVSIGSAIVLMRLIRMQVVAAGVEPEEVTADEMENASLAVQKSLSSAVYDIGTRVFQSRAERN